MRVPHHVRELTENRERAMLSPFAMKSLDSAGRDVTEDPDPVRTVYQRDRDRILHSKSFRRLKHKTQVFIDPEGDHYRTRLTHTLEVAQVARTIGRALRLNEDLIEAIALGHDVGHTPFGHAGESALDEAIREQGFAHGPHHFRHYEQSLRVVEILEPLNLTVETRAGIDGHSKGQKDLTDADGESVSTLEAAVVRISDRIAYLNADLDDALRSGIISEIPHAFAPLGQSHGERVGRMVTDVIEQSFDRPALSFSPPLLTSLNELKEWLFENVYYRYPIQYPEIQKAKYVVKDLFHNYLQPGNLPPEFGESGDAIHQSAIDYVAGMTDRYAIETFRRLRVPEPWPRL